MAVKYNHADREAHEVATVSVELVTEEGHEVCRHRHFDSVALKSRAVVAVENSRDHDLPILDGRILDVDVAQAAVGLEVCLLARPVEDSTYQSFVHAAFHLDGDLYTAWARAATCRSS